MNNSTSWDEVENLRNKLAKEKCKLLNLINWYTNAHDATMVNVLNAVVNSLGEIKIMNKQNKITIEIPKTLISIKNRIVRKNIKARWIFTFGLRSSISHTGTYLEAVSAAEKSYRYSQNTDFGRLKLVYINPVS